MSWGNILELWGVYAWGADAETTPGNALAFDYPSFDFDAASGGALAFDMPPFEMSLESVFVSRGELELSYPQWNFQLFSHRLTDGDLNIQYPLWTFSFHGAESPDGDLDIEFPPFIFNLASRGTFNPLVVNMDNLAGPVRYDNYPFVTAFMYGGDLYLGNSDGLYKVTGTDDDGTNISAYFLTWEDEMGVSQLKSLADIIISVQGGPLEVQSFHDNTFLPVMPVLASTDMISRRAKHGRGAKLRFWGVKVSNKSGSAATIETIELNPMILSRKLSQ